MLRTRISLERYGNHNAYYDGLQRSHMELQRTENLRNKIWTSVGASIKSTEMDLFNKQLDNLQCKTLKDLCSLLIGGKLTTLTDDEQIQVMKSQTQATGLSTIQIGEKFDFWKQIDDQDLHKWLLGRYHP
ncbi:MAG: hypothetical protein WB474_12980, partial [Nitrososphaeraceae archaeon]